MGGASRATQGARIAAAGLALVALVALAGCTSDSDLSSQYEKSAGKGYVSSDGSVVTVPAAKRQKSLTWWTKDYDGDTVSSASLRGKVVVLNFWYAGCPPCRAEAPILKEIATELEPKGIVFLGVNTQDSAATAKGFATKNGLDYPSVLDADDGLMVQTFAGDVPPNAVPVTLVLDKQGRVAARFSGPITSASTVEDIVEDVQAEKS